MPAKHFTYTDPAYIEGESQDVAKLAAQQTRDLAEVVAELSKATFVQLRAAGIDPDIENAVEAWLDTEEGARARDLLLAARHFVEAANVL